MAGRPRGWNAWTAVSSPLPPATAQGNPSLVADIFGDWREELLLRTVDSTAIRVYLSTELTNRKLYTLMHDPQYRMQVSGEQTAYNQPPHPGFHIGSGMAAPPAPNIQVR